MNKKSIQYTKNFLKEKIKNITKKFIKIKKIAKK